MKGAVRGVAAGRAKGPVRTNGGAVTRHVGPPDGPRAWARPKEFKRPPLDGGCRHSWGCCGRGVGPLVRTAAFRRCSRWCRRRRRRQDQPPPVVGAAVAASDVGSAAAAGLLDRPVVARARMWPAGGAARPLHLRHSRGGVGGSRTPPAVAVCAGRPPRAGGEAAYCATRVSCESRQRRPVRTA